MHKTLPLLSRILAVFVAVFAVHQFEVEKYSGVSGIVASSNENDEHPIQTDVCVEQAQRGLVTSGISSFDREGSPEKWFYAYVDLERDATNGGDDTNYSVDEFVESILPRLAQAKYNAIILSNYYLGSKERLNDSNSRFVRNLTAVATAAADHGIEIIPEVMNVGSSASILLNNPQLAEGTPARAVEFIVKERAPGELYAEIANKQNLIPSGSLDGEIDDLKRDLGVYHTANVRIHQSEAGTNKTLIVEKLQPATDDEVEQSGSFSISLDNIQLKSYRQYRFSFQLKTKHLSPTSPQFIYSLIRSRFKTNIRRLERVAHKIESDQEWTTYVVSFNSLDRESAELIFAFEEIWSGKFWLDNLVLQEVGGVNLLRRTDLPIEVSVKDGDELDETVDFEEWIDPEVGFDGFYDHDEDPPLIELVERDELPVEAGDTLLVSYYHAALPNANGHRVCCSVSHLEVRELMRMQIRQLKSIIGSDSPLRWLVNHDEIRAFGHEPAAEGIAPGALLGGMLTECVNIINTESPGSKIVLINDMYDPFHNAGPWNNEFSYHPMVNGSFENSWDSIPRDGQVSIWNWSLGEVNDIDEGLGYVRASFGFFADKGLDQIVGGFYDVVESNDDESGGTEQEEKDFVQARAIKHFQAAKNNGNVTAVCYYSSKKDDRFVELFGEIADSVWGPLVVD